MGVLIAAVFFLNVVNIIKACLASENIKLPPIENDNLLIKYNDDVTVEAKLNKF